MKRKQRTFKQKFNKRFNQPLSQPNSKKRISKLTGVPSSVLDEVFDRGVGAYKTNPKSVRPQVKSPEQWAMSRVYSFIEKGYNAVEKNKKKIDQDQDLFNKVKDKLD